MAAVCAFPSAATPVLESVTTFVDCQARGLGESGFHALGDGVLFPAVLAGCLTISVALIGYRLILGHSFSITDGVLSVLRIALVIMFCTRWPSYEAVFYNVVTDGPAELVGTVLERSGLPTLSASESAARLDRAYSAIAQQAGAARPPSQAQAQAQAQVQVQTAQSTGPPVSQPSQTPVSLSPSQQEALRVEPQSSAGVLFKVSSLGGLLATHVVAGVLLAIGPILIVLGLFNGTIGFFVGWLRALGGAALGAAGASIVVALEVTFVEARLADAAGSDGVAFSEQGLMVVSLLFLLITVVVLGAAGVVARGFNLGTLRIGQDGGSAVRQGTQAIASTGQPTRLTARPPEMISRARSIADAFARQAQREQFVRQASPLDPVRVPLGSGRASALREPDGPTSASKSLGSGLRRDSSRRRTLSAIRRDGRS